MAMTAMNIVRMRVKPGKDEAYVEAHRKHRLSEFKGMRSVNLVKTGDRDYVVVGEWDSMEALVAARPAMIAMLDSFRDLLEDLGGGLGVTDPRSGEVVLRL